MTINTAYGWIDGDSPNDVPAVVVVGVARDPLMAVGLRVTNMEDSTAFFTDQLGMKVLPFPLARQKNSIFEPQEPSGSRYLGYSENSLGIILLPSPKNAPPLTVGDQIDKFTIVYDDSKDSTIILPLSVQAAIAESKIIVSPDGYKFAFQSLPTHEMKSTKSIESDLD